MKLPRAFLDTLRERLTLSEIIGRHTKLTRQGREFVGLCPFHNEKTPSFNVNDSKGFYHCFGCGAHGDAVSFLMNRQSAGFMDAVGELAREAGLTLPAPTPQARVRERQRQDDRTILERAARWFSRQLFTASGERARLALERRGLDRACMAAFRFGYAPGGDGLVAAMAAQDISGDDLVRTGLYRQTTGDRPARPVFRDRIVIPVTDPRNRVIAFGGRALGDRLPKYLNSPETDLFHKGSVLFNEAAAAPAARAAGTVLLVEGYMDVVALDRAGFAHGVAPMGTALTETQLQRLWRLADIPILCFDGDRAGERAAIRAADRALPLLRPGRSLRFATLPTGEDPDSLLAARGAAGLTGLLDRAEDLVDLLWRTGPGAGARGANTPEARAALERTLYDKIGSIADDGVRWQYRHVFRNKFRQLWYARAGWRSGSGTGRDPGWRSAGPGGTPEPVPKGDPKQALLRQEAALLAALIRHPQILRQEAERLADLDLTGHEHRAMLAEMTSHITTTGELDSHDLERHLTETGFAARLETVLGVDTYRHASFAGPNAAPESVMRVLDDVLARQHRLRLKADRQAACRELAGYWAQDDAATDTGATDTGATDTGATDTGAREDGAADHRGRGDSARRASERLLHILREDIGGE